MSKVLALSLFLSAVFSRAHSTEPVDLGSDEFAKFQAEIAVFERKVALQKRVAKLQAEITDYEEKVALQSRSNDNAPENGRRGGCGGMAPPVLGKGLLSHYERELAAKRKLLEDLLASNPQ